MIRSEDAKKDSAKEALRRMMQVRRKRNGRPARIRPETASRTVAFRPDNLKGNTGNRPTALEYAGHGKMRIRKGR